MTYGYNGKVLRVNLSSGEIEVEQPDPLFYRRYLGGRGFASYYLLRELSPGVDPLGPDNLLVFASSALSGAPAPGLSRYTVAAKSPLTGGYGDSEAGGWFGPELKRAGFDGILLKGRAPRPVYLWVKNGHAEIRNAEHLWGQSTGDTQDAIRHELADQRVRIALIGPAGEKMVSFACVLNELKHANGRTGMGAVMGSKNLKAIAVRGDRSLPLHNPNQVKEIARWVFNEFRDNPLSRALTESGTPGVVAALDHLSALPTRNFQAGRFENVESIDWDAYQEQIFNKGETCFGCPIACKRQVRRLEPPYELDPRYGGPEYEALAAFGSNCGVDNIQAVARANQLCNKYGLDTISTGAIIAFAMECYEKGILTDTDTGGLVLRFGNADAMLQMVEMIANREGLGNLLARGIKQAAEEIGPEAELFAQHVKGQPLAMHTVRDKFGIAVGFAVSNTGADHLVFPFDTLFQQTQSYSLSQIASLGILEPVKASYSGPAKIRLLYYGECIFSLWNAAGACNFVFAPRSLLPLDKVVALVQAITGWETSLFELLKIGERVVNLGRLFNLREGFTRKDDTLPERFFIDSEIGKKAGVGIHKTELEQALTLLYQMKGWDPDTGIPTRAKLEELDIGWAEQA
jgi:aldehyde:ferredoxin oxidoreductase